MPQPSQTSSVLVVDDEASLRKVIRTSLTANGFAVEEAASGLEAVDRIQHKHFEAVLLDVNMPGMSGLEACRRIRGIAPRSGILMITVRDSEDDKVDALEAGADDYLTKPFRIRELVARLHAVLRRVQMPRDRESGVFQASGLKMDVTRRRVWKRGEAIHLSPKEFDLLAILMKNSGASLTHSKLLQAVWGPDSGSEVEYLRTYVRVLRKKIEDDPQHPDYIKTESAIGYRFHNPSYPDQPLTEPRA